MMVFIFILSVVLLVMLPESQRYLLIPVIITMMLYHYKSTKTNTPTGEIIPAAVDADVADAADVDTPVVAPATIITAAPTDVYDNADAMPYADANVDSGAVPPHDEQQHWMQNERHTTCYKPPPSLEQLNDCDYQAHLPFDEACARMATLRKRDKQAIDGAVSKNANYFKKHYGDELSREESKPWWGNDDY